MHVSIQKTIVRIHSKHLKCYLDHMDNDYPYTQLEYAKLLGLSKAGLISRRKAGKLEGQYIVKNKCYFYSRLRPDQVKHTPKTYTKERRRGAHNSGATLKYPNAAFKEHNEAKMMAKLRSNLDQETLDLIPEAIEVAKKAKQDRIRETITKTKQPTKHYGYGPYNSKYATPRWRSLDAKPIVKRFTYY